MGELDFKSTISGDAIINAYQRKAIAEQEAKIQNEQLKIQKTNQMLEVTKMVGNLVSGAIEHSKARQKQDFVNSLADSMATKFGTTPNPQPALSTHFPQPIQTASFDPDKANAMRAAVQVSPNAAAESLFKQTLPTSPMAAARQKSVSNYVDPEGNLVRIITDTVSGKNLALSGPYAGEEVPDDYMESLQPGYAPKTFTDPATGEVKRLTSSGTTSGITGPAQKRKPGEAISEFNQLNAREKQYVDKEVAASQKDGVVTRINERIAKFNEAEAILATPNWVTDATLGAILARTVASEVGNLNETEQQRYNVTPEVWRGIKTKVSRWMTGARTEEDRADIAKVLDILKQKAEDNRERRINLYVNRLSNKIPGIDKEAFKGQFFSQDEDGMALTAEDEANAFLSDLE